MPFAKKFRAMMNFPFPGDTIGDFSVESVDVHDEQGDGDGYVYGVRMVLKRPRRGAGRETGTQGFFLAAPDDLFRVRQSLPALVQETGNREPWRTALRGDRERRRGAGVPGARIAALPAIHQRRQPTGSSVRCSRPGSVCRSLLGTLPRRDPSARWIVTTGKLT